MSSSTSLSLFSPSILPNDLWTYIGRSLVVRDLTALFLSNVYLYTQSIDIFSPIDRDAHIQLGLEYTEANSINLDRTFPIGSASTIGEIFVHPLRFLTLERIVSVWLQYSPAALTERRTFIETHPILPLYSDLLEDANILFRKAVIRARGVAESEDRDYFLTELVAANMRPYRIGQRFVIARAISNDLERQRTFSSLILSELNSEIFSTLEKKDTTRYPQLIVIIKYLKQIRPTDREELEVILPRITDNIISYAPGRYTNQLDPEYVAHEIFKRTRDIIFLFDRTKQKELIDNVVIHIQDKPWISRDEYEVAEIFQSLITDEQIRLGFLDEDASDSDEDTEVEYPSSPTTTAQIASITTTTTGTDESNEQESKAVKRKRSSSLPEDERRPEKKPKRSESPNSANGIPASDGMGDIDTGEASENAPDSPEPNATASEERAPAKRSLYSDIMSDDEE